MAITKKQNPEPQNPFEDDGLELVFVNPKTDVLKAQAVIGPAPMAFYHQKIIKDLVEQAIKRVKPELHEMEGYEIIKYELIIKPHKSKPRT